MSHTGKGSGSHQKQTILIALPRRVSHPSPLPPLSRQPHHNIRQLLIILLRLPQLTVIPRIHHRHNLDQRGIRAAHPVLHYVPVPRVALSIGPDSQIQIVAFADQLVEIADLVWGDLVAWRDSLKLVARWDWWRRCWSCWGWW